MKGWSVSCPANNEVSLNVATMDSGWWRDSEFSCGPTVFAPEVGMDLADAITGAYAMKDGASFATPIVARLLVCLIASKCYCGPSDQFQRVKEFSQKLPFALLTLRTASTFLSIVTLTSNKEGSFCCCQIS